MDTRLDNRAPAQSIDYRKYEVDVRFCRMMVGDCVTPETVIGWNPTNGQPVRAVLAGEIATIYFNPMHDSLMIMAIAGGN